ncbi:MAG: hypothetical protein ACPGU9_07880 [Flavobacteriaceae bacterium]
MKHLTIIISTLILVISLGACRKDFNTSASSGDLRFSKDTVFLDTIFTNIGSSTYNLKVYNRGSDDIHIPTIALGRGTNSNFRLMVDGIAGQYFENVEIKAKDSIFIFVETTVDILDYSTTATEFLYKDSIVFDANAQMQDVKLVTLVKDAEFIYPPALEDGELNDFELTAAQLHWTNTKPYVIYGYPKVPDGETLTIDPGSRIHFHRNSGLIVENGATIIADGSLSTDQDLLENEIIFEGDRLEPMFSDIPGQWGTIWLQEGSTNNLFDYVTIKNGTIGVRSDFSDGDLTTTFTNTQFYNHSVSGLFAIDGNIVGQNMIVSNCGQASVNIAHGGTYNFTHCTFTNYWNSGFRSFPTLAISDWLGDTADHLYANFTNCIIYGNENIELIFDQQSNGDFEFNFKNCLIRFNDFNNQYGNNPLYDFNNTTFYDNSIFNQDPKFLDKFDNKFQIEELESPADNTGFEVMPSFSDILNTTRSSGNYDIGAYQAIVFPDEN